MGSTIRIFRFQDVDILFRTDFNSEGETNVWDAWEEEVRIRPVLDVSKFYIFIMSRGSISIAKIINYNIQCVYVRSPFYFSGNRLVDVFQGQKYKYK
jgi:hypothetical protein